MFRKGRHTEEGGQLVIPFAFLASVPARGFTCRQVSEMAGILAYLAVVARVPRSGVVRPERCRLPAGTAFGGHDG